MPTPGSDEARGAGGWLWRGPSPLAETATAGSSFSSDTPPIYHGASGWSTEETTAARVVGPVVSPVTSQHRHEALEQRQRRREHRLDRLLEHRVSLPRRGRGTPRVAPQPTRGRAGGRRGARSSRPRTA